MGMPEKIDAAIHDYDASVEQRFAEQAKLTGEVISRLFRAIDGLHSEIMRLNNQVKELSASRSAPVRGTTQK